MKKIISIMMIIAVLAGLVACGAAEPNGTTNAADNATTASGSEQMQATGSVPTTEGDKQGENSDGQPVDGTTNTSEAGDPSTQASTSAAPTTEPGTEKTEPTQPTQPQPTDPPHQHSYTATVVAPTCNDKGYTKHTCACGDSYNDNYTDALGHHFIDEVVAPTSTEQGYTKHTCDRCWYSYKDSYTDPVKVEWWDTEAAVAAVCADANAYIASLGLTVDPTSPCWVAPQYTHWEGSSEAWLRNQIWGGIDLYHSEGFTNMYVTYEPDPAHGGWIVYLKYQLVWGN